MSGAISELRFSKYRAFDQKQKIRLRPLTLLFGKNSVGKSAALRAFPILSSSILSHPFLAEGAIFDYSSPSLRDATFSDLIYMHETANKLELGLSWADLDVDYTISKLGPLDPETIQKIEITSEDQSNTVVPAQLGGTEFFTTGSNFYDQLNYAFNLNGFVPETTDETPRHIKRKANDLHTKLISFANQTHWIGAVRAAVPRYFQVDKGARHGIAWDGGGTAEVLHDDWRKGGEVNKSVSKWLRRTTNSALTFSETSTEQIFGRMFAQYEVYSEERGKVAVRDVGEGIAQALPILTLCHQARLGQLGSSPILALEQPELHLHPKAGVELANEVIDCISWKSPATHIIETHSENLLLAVQIAIVQGSINPADVIVYWISDENNNANVKEIEFDEDGFPADGWPQGVFREANEQARLLSKLRLKE